MRLLLCTFLLMSGCVSHKLRCDAHLQPINPPAHRAPPAPLPPPPAPSRGAS